MKIAEYNEMMAYMLRPASLEEKLKELEEKYPGSVKPANELPPIQDPFKDFEDRNPRETAAQGGVIGGGTIKGEDLGSRTGFGTPTKGIISSGEYAGQPFARHRADELPKGSIRFSVDKIVFTGEDAQKNIDRFFNNRLSDKEFKKLRNQNKNLSNKEFLELIKKDYVNVRGGEWKELAIDQKTSALTNIRKTELMQPIDDPQRLKDIKKYFRDYKKQNNKFPTVQEAEDYFESKLGKQIRPSILLAAEEANIDLPSGLIGQKLKVDRDVGKLLNRKTIIDTLEAGKFPTESQIQTVLKSNRTKASSRQVDLANYLAGNVKPEIKTNITVPTKYKNIATTAINNLELVKEGQFGPRKTKTRTYNEKRLAKILGIDSFPLLRKNILDKITSFIPELKGLLNVDEIGSLTAGSRTDSPYTIFGQILGKDFNKYTKSTAIDKSKSILERKLITLAKDDPQRSIELEKYNQKVDNFEQMANKNNPAKKVKGMKLSFLPPSKAIKNKKVYNEYKDLFDAHYEKYGYSFEVDKDTDSLTDISKKLDKKSYQNEIKNNFKSLIDRPGPRGGKVAITTALATLAGTGFALADDMTPNEEGLSTAEKTGIGAGVAGGAYAARKPILNTLAKIARPFSIPSVAAGFGLGQFVDVNPFKFASDEEREAGKSFITRDEKFGSLKEDPSFALAGADLLYPEIAKQTVGKFAKPTGKGILSMLGRAAMNPFGKLVRGFTPVGIGLQGVELVNQARKEQDRINEMRMNDPDQYQEYLDELESYGDFSA